MAADDSTRTLAAVSPALRQRATAIQVIGAPAADRSAQRQQRLGFSLLLALGFGWDSLQAAANPAAPFEVAIGQFLLIFVATVGTIRALGNLYDRYADEAARRARTASAAKDNQPSGTTTMLDTDQPATSGQ